MVSRDQVMNMLQRNASYNDSMGSTNGAGYIGGGYIGGVCNNCMRGGCAGCMAGNGYIGGATMGGFAGQSKFALANYRRGRNIKDARAARHKAILAHFANDPSGLKAYKAELEVLRNRVKDRPRVKGKFVKAVPKSKAKKGKKPCNSYPKGLQEFCRLRKKLKGKGYTLQEISAKYRAGERAEDY